MDTNLAQSTQQTVVHRLWVLRLLTGIGFLLATSGFASHRPAPLLVTQQFRDHVSNGMEKEVRLKLLTYNIWGLPSWMTCAPTRRYQRIGHELERLDPDIILLQEAWTAKSRKSAPSNGNWSVARAAGPARFFSTMRFNDSVQVPNSWCSVLSFFSSSIPRSVREQGRSQSHNPVARLILNIWNVHLQNGGPVSIRESQIRELVSWVSSAEDNQIADIVGGDFNCTPTSPEGKELENSVGPSVLRLGKVEPFATWNALSSKPGAGETLDYLFIHNHAAIQTLHATPRAAFAAASKRQRLSDHLAVESVVNLSPGKTLVATVGPQLQSALFEGHRAPQIRGRFLRLVAARWLGLEPCADRLFALKTASVRELGYEKSRPSRLSSSGTIRSHVAD